jgi:hypothetical protein
MLWARPLAASRLQSRVFIIRSSSIILNYFVPGPSHVTPRPLWISTNALHEEHDKNRQKEAEAPPKSPETSLMHPKVPIVSNNLNLDGKKNAHAIQ